MTPTVVEGDVKQWLGKAIEGLKKTSIILELGSGPGRDALYLESFGYSVQRSDASDGFVNRLREGGYKTKKINAITDALGGPYDLIFANCVFLHFTKNEFEKVLNKITKSLSPRGILAFSVKRGEGSEMISNKVNAPRFFQYWSMEELRKVLNKHGYNVNKIWNGKINELDKIYIIASMQ